MTRFVHLTDLHISHPEAEDPTLNADTPAMLRHVVEVVNGMRHQPDFVVASGDLTNMGDARSYGLLKEILAPLRAPLVMALGNHDKRAGYHEVFGTAGSEAPYFHDGLQADLHVITLDTGVPGRVAGAIEGAQFDFLAEALTRHPDKRKLLIMHHPPRIDPDGLPWGSIDMDSTERLAATLDGYDVVGILSGHIHINRVAHWHGIPVVITIGLNSTVDMLEADDLRIVEGTGFGICDLRDSGLSVSFVPLSPEAREIKTIDQARLRAFA